LGKQQGSKGKGQAYEPCRARKKHDPRWLWNAKFCLVLSPAPAGLSKLSRPEPEFAQGSSIFVENQLGATYAAGCTIVGGVHHKGL